MSESLYELAFSGRLVDGVSLETAKGNVVKLFKASAAQVDKMFAGKRVVIRNKLDKATADKYVAVMRKNGLVCQADLMGGKAAPVQPAANATSAVSKPAVSPSTEPAQAAAELTSTNARSAGQSGAAIAKTPEELRVLPLPSNFAAPESGEPHEAGINLAGEEVDGILQQSRLDLDPEGVRLSEHHEVEAPVFTELESISLAPTGSDLVDPKEEVPPIVPDVSSISIAPAGSDMGQLKNEQHVEVPDLSHLKLDDLPDNQ